MDKNYKFGIVIKTKLKGWGFRNIGICSCGQHMIGENYQTNFECDKCANNYFFYYGYKPDKKKRFTIPLLEVLHKDNRGFKVKRTNLTVEYDGEKVVPIKENMTRLIEYDIVDEILKSYKNNELEYDYSIDGGDSSKIERTINHFFVNVRRDDFIRLVSNDNTYSLYNIFESTSYRYNYRKMDIIYEFIRLFKYKHLQILCNAGFKNVSRFVRNHYYHNTVQVIDSSKTKPHEILKVPKFMIKFIRDDTSVNLFVLSELQKNIKYFDGNTYREILEIIKDEGKIRDFANISEAIIQLHLDYGYNNLKKLILYLFRDVRMNQGITSPSEAITLLRDYIRMSNLMGIEYEKYPKSLKKEHDITLMNYNLNKSEYKQKEFKMAVGKQSYQDLVFKDKDFSIITPNTSDDIIKEGNQLSHCVGSYINDVIDEKCKIYFLRKTDDIEQPLVTIEVRGKNIRQARGFCNRKVREDEKEFIKKWAEEKRLVEAYY